MMLDTEDYADVRTPEERALDALQMAITRTITETFALCGEEQIWLLYQMGSLLKPLTGHKPQMVSLATINEMNRNHNTKPGHHSINTEYTTANTVKLINDPHAIQASLEEWANVMIHLIVSSYNTSDLLTFQMKTRMMGVLAELGVGNPNTPRPSRYLPNDVRHWMNGNKAA